MSGLGWLDEAEQRIKATTEGPWSAKVGGIVTGPVGVMAVISTGDRHDQVFIAAARSDLPRAVEALKAVLVMHRQFYVPGHAYDICEHCDRPWPCPTVAAIEGAS